MTKLHERVVQALALSLALFLFSGASDPASRFTEIGHQLKCICGSCEALLLECNHVGCTYSDNMRNELAAAVQRGDSDSLVEQSFVQKYGPTVLAAPTTSGFDRVAWIMPIVALFFGVALVIFVVRSWKHRPAPALASGIHARPSADLDQFREQARRETDL